jgi:hypothetical protein
VNDYIVENLSLRNKAFEIQRTHPALHLRLPVNRGKSLPDDVSNGFSRQSSDNSLHERMELYGLDTEFIGPHYENVVNADFFHGQATGQDGLTKPRSRSIENRPAGRVGARHLEMPNPHVVTPVLQQTMMLGLDLRIAPLVTQLLKSGSLLLRPNPLKHVCLESTDRVIRYRPGHSCPAQYRFQRARRGQYPNLPALSVSGVDAITV